MNFKIGMVIIIIATGCSKEYSVCNDLNDAYNDCEHQKNELFDSRELYTTRDFQIRMNMLNNVADSIANQQAIHCK